MIHWALLTLTYRQRVCWVTALLVLCASAYAFAEEDGQPADNGATEGSTEGTADDSWTDDSALLFGGANDKVVFEGDDSSVPDEIPAGTGNVVGQVFDSESSKTITGVTVILQWPKEEASEEAGLIPREKVSVTDGDGEYRFLDVPSGVYSIRFTKAGYREGEWRKFVVYPDKANRANFPLKEKQADMAADIFDMDEFIITEEALNDYNVLNDFRQENAGSIDFLSSEDFSKYASTDVSDVINRMPGVTVVEGKFAVVRGLGDRYNSTYLNELPITSPDPVRQGLQLDLFPTSIIDNVISNKTFLPYNASNSTGAAFNLNTKAIPDEFEGSFKAGFRFNTNALDTFLVNPASKGLYPNPFEMNQNDRPTFTDNGADAIAQQKQILPAIVGVKKANPIGISLGVNFGESFEVWNRNVGLIMSFSYDTSYTTQIGTDQKRYYTDNGILGTPPPNFPGSPYDSSGNIPGLDPGFIPGGYYTGDLLGSGVHYDYTNSVADTLYSGMGGLTMDLDPDGLNKVSFVALGTFNSIDQVVRRSNGYMPAGYAAGIPISFNGTVISRVTTDYGRAPAELNLVGRNLGGTPGNLLMNQDVLNYEERKLGALQVFGEHQLIGIDELEFTWGYTHVYTSSNTPNQSVFTYFEDVDTGNYITLPVQTTAGLLPLTQTWRDITEQLDAFRLDFAREWELDDENDIGFRGGYLHNQSGRKTSQTYQYWTTVTAGGTADTPSGAGDEYIDASNPANVVSYADANVAVNNRNINAGHITGNYRWDMVEVTGGVRMEKILLSTNGNPDAFIPGRGTRTLRQVLNYRPSGPQPQNLTNGQLINFTNPDAGGLIDQTNYLPAATFKIDPIEGLTIKGGANVTFAQPSFRELTPIMTYDPVQNDYIVGNSNLQLSRAVSYDIGLSYEFESGAYIAFGAFYKTINNPIEQIRLQDEDLGPFITFFNNPGKAQLKGLEFEARTDLSFLGDELENFSIGLNAAYINARVSYPDSVFSSYFNILSVDPATGQPSNVSGPGVGYDGPPYGNNSPPTSRRLFDQPEWITNADISYDNPDTGTVITLAVFAQSDVLTTVGSGFSNSADEYTEAYYQLDVIVQQSLGFFDPDMDNVTVGMAFKNITNTKRGLKYAGEPLEGQYQRMSYRAGVDVRFSVTATF